MKVLVCDLDKTILPYGGIVLDEQVKHKLIALQQHGFTLVLASARIAGGVIPVAKDLQMDKYHGYVIANNGSFTYDMNSTKVIDGFEISLDICDSLLDFAKQNDLHVSFEQQDFAVATQFDEALQHDRANCQIDYILTNDIHKYITKPVYKCSITQTKECIDKSFQALVSLLEKDYDVFRSTDTFVDIIKKGCAKEIAVGHLLEKLQIPFSEVCAIGDGDSDANMIKNAGLGVTLENGSTLCKKYANMIVPSCTENGCLVLFDYLLKNKEN